MKNSDGCVENKQPLVTVFFILLNVVLYYSVADPLQLCISPLQLLSEPTFINTSKEVLSNFLHINFTHLFGNMMIMAVTGFHVEKKFGHKNMCLLILLSLMGSIAATLVCLASLPVVTLGASGVVAGVTTCYLLRY